MATVQFDTGNFRLNITGTPNAETTARLIENGLRYEVQREVASKVYVDVAGEETKGKDGKVVKRLPKDFERSSLEYSDETAEAFRESAEKVLADFGDDFAVTVEKYEGSEAASPMKRATALVDSFLGTDMESAYRAILGSPKGERDELVKLANEKGLGIQPPKAKKA